MVMRFLLLLDAHTFFLLISPVLVIYL
jgi:hypothetical protein